jgi:hypothetical protein
MVVLREVLFFGKIAAAILERCESASIRSYAARSSCDIVSARLQWAQ